eukprot:364069-Chlamydomonas_euryale.AAC.3
MLAVRPPSLRLLPAARSFPCGTSAKHLLGLGAAHLDRPAAQATNFTARRLFGAVSSGQQQSCQQPQVSASALCLLRRQLHRGVRPHTDRMLMAWAAAADATLGTEQLRDGAVYCVGRK